MSISDDFASGALDPVWTIEGPSGISAALGTDASDAWLELVTPDGNHDAWNSNSAARAMQATADGDFQVETRFLSTPSEKYQLQGLLVEQDTDNWLRFDTHSNGSKLYAFAAITIDGVSSQAFRVKIPGGEAPYLRLTRSGDDWTFDYSTDGNAWVTAGSFTHALNVTQAGVFAGNTGAATGFVAQVDYFENSADPIVDEDGTIAPVNNAPDAVDDVLATDEDVALVIDVDADLLANDSDPDGDPFNLTGVTQPANGTLTDNGDGTYTYTPDAGFSGSDSFTYTISDGSAGDTATVDVTVNDTTPSNDPPNAVNDALSTDEDVALLIDVDADLLANDSDPDGDPFNLTGVTQPANGTLTDNGDGTYTYTPDAGFSGTDSFSYTISDGSASDTATVNVTVSDPPSASDLTSDDFASGALDPVWTIEGPSGISAALGTDASDAWLELVTPDGNHDAWNSNSAARAMQATADGDFQVETRFLSTPSEKYQLQGLLVEQDTDNWLRFDTHSNGSKLYAFAAITIDGVSSQAFRVTIPGGEAPYLRLTRSGDDWTFDYSTDGNAWVTAGSFTHALNVTQAGVFAGNTGAATGFVAQVDYFENSADPIVDEDGTIAPVNNAPDAVDDVLATDEDVALVIDVDADLLANDSDPDGDPFNLTGVTQPANGTLTDNGDGTYTYTPDAGFSGSDSFTYTISDGSAGDTATVDVTVNDTTPSNDPPNAVNDALSTDEDVALLIDVDADLLANDSDPDGDPFNLTGVTQPANGTLTDNGDGTYTYTPDAGFSGTDSFSYTISDGSASDTATVNVTVSDPPSASDLTSDDFASGALDPVWTIEGPSGISAALGTDASDAWLELVTPDGNHDAWNSNSAARAMQATADGDFQVETRFLSTPSEKYQLQGLLVEQDTDNWLRFDTHSNGSKLYAFAAITIDGVSSQAFRVTIPGGEAPYLRLTRSGDDWTFDYSTDGNAWVTAGSFTHALNVTQAGVFAGNTGAATGFVAQVDYFENSADPIVDEDGTIVTVNLPPDAVDDALVTPIDAALAINVDADLLANDSDPNGDPFNLTGVTQPANGTLTDNGDGTYTYTPDAGFSGVDSFTYTISDGEFPDTATVTVAVGNPIDVWYGLNQSFGSPGEGQEWINILGNVGGNVTSLSYSLNGGPEQVLSIGEDTRRLQESGDFNIDLSYSALDGSAVDDVVTITAVLAGGTMVSRDVVIDYESGNDWDPNYSIDWDTVTDIQDVVQVVDGTWSWDGNGVRPVDLGYDRLLVLGDQSWDNYELTMTVTMHDLENVDPRGRDGGAFAIGMLWDGHTDEPVSNFQPKSGWEPGATFFYTHLLKSHSYHEFSELLGVQNFSLQEGLSYNFTVRVEQTGIYDRVYSLKVWEVGTAEPVGWTLQTTEAFSLDEAPATGSIYLNAHYFDVTFGDLTVTEITGSDIIQGDDSAEVLIAVDTGAADPGQGEIDVFTGALGADVFIFGDANGSYYDDGIAGDSGEGDYGFVWDFTSGSDQVQLAGSATDYVMTEDAPGHAPGTAIWLLGQGGDADELIGVLNGAYGLDPMGADFIYTDDLLV